MRGALLTLVPLFSSGCALWMPAPDPTQAWVDLRPAEGTRLEALAVDDKALADDRYFQVAPGARALEMRYRFEVSADNVGGPDGLPRDCRLRVEYGGFGAGQRYRLEAGGHGFRPWAKLYDAEDRLLARAREQGCGATLAGVD